MSNEIEITQWLNSDLRVENKVKNIEDDLKNGFLYRDILMRLGVPVPSSIVNKTDEITVKANYATVGSILRDKLKITLQPRVGQHIEVLKQIFKYYQGKTLKGGSTGLGNKDQEESLVEQFNKSLKTKDKHLKESFKYEEEGLRRLMPQKIQNIESKLEKFRQQKIRSEILAKSLKDQELERENQWRIEHRQFEINKVRSNHTYIADKTKSIYKNWEKTMEIAHTRVDKEVKLNQYLTNRMKGEVKDQLDQEFKDYKQGLDYFKENCLHQGIQLAHDPDNLKPPPKSNFNMNAAMMKIREKTHKNILARKDKEKRMLVEQERYEREIQAKKDEEEMLDGFIQVSAAGGLVGDKIKKNQEKEAFCVVLRIQKEKQVQEERLQYFDQKHEEFRETALKNEQERKVMWKTQKLEYMEQNLERKIQKRKKHSKACLDLFDVILDVTELCYSHQKHHSSSRVQEEYWRDLMVRFGEGKPLSDEKQVTIFSEEQQQGTQPEEKEESAQIGMMFQDYNMGFGMWQPLHYFEQPEQQILNHAYNDDQLGDFLHTVIDKIYPKVPVNSKPADIPEYLPLRMSIMGDRFAGKKGIAQLLKYKYGLQMIEVNEVLETAIKIAFPPPEDENDKKKNAKKAPKKGQVEEEKPENPELKELGVLANEFKSQNQPYSDEILVKAAVVQIKALFGQLTTEQLVNQVNESKAKEDERIAGLKKEYEEILKKKEKANPKKPASKESKKDAKTKESEKIQEVPVNDEPILESVEDATYRIMTQKEFEFTPGYILLNFPTNLHQAKLLEESLTGYVIPEQRLNPQGEQLKEEVAQLVRGSEQVVDTSVREGGLDLVVSLHVPAEIGEKRAANRRLDPNTAIIYNLEDNQPNMEEKGLADRLQQIEDAQATLEKIDQSNQAFEQNMEELGPWFSQFGFEVQQQIIEPSRQGTANGEHHEQGHEHQQEKQEQQVLKTNPQTSQSQRSHAEVTENDKEAVEHSGEEENVHVLSSLFQKEAISRKVEIFEDIDKQIARVLSIKKARIQEIVEEYNKQQAIIKEKEQQEQLLKAQQEALEKERIDAENKLIQENNKNAAKGGQKGAANDKNQPKNGDKNKANNTPAAVAEPPKVEEPKEVNEQVAQENKEIVDPEKVSAEGEQQQQQQSAENDGEGDVSSDQVNHQETVASQVKLPHDADFIEAIKHENYLIVMKMWNETQKSYVKEIKEGLVKLDTHRELIASRLADVQFRFLSVVQRPDDKQHKITVFQDNLHNFFEENPQMLRFQNTKDELSEHLEHLYETLWDSVEAKKIESINERKKIMSSGWFDSEIATLFGTYLRLFQVEINKLEEIMEILLYSGDIAEGRPINEVQEHIILDPFPDGSTLPDLCDQLDTNSFPRIEKMFSHFVEKVEKIEELIDEIRMKFFKKRVGTTSDTWAMSNEKLLELYQTVLDTEKGVCLYRGYVLKYSLISRVKELKLIEAALYTKLDDWIIFGLKNENDVIYEAIGQLRQSINTSTAIQPLVVQVKNISETYKILTCMNQIPAMIQPVEIIREEEDVRMSVFQLKLVYEELHTLCDKRDGLNLKLYENVMIRRKKMNNNSNNLPNFIKQLPDSAIMNTAKNLASQMNDGKVDFKDVMMCFILLGTPLPDTETLDSLKEHLLAFSNSGYIENHSFLTVESWFDESERDDNVYGETKFHRIICLKQLIFDLFSENDPYLLSVSKYIESLKRLSNRGKMFFWQVLFD